MKDEDRAALMVSSRSATHADPETLETHDAARGDVYKCETCFLLTELDRVTAQEEETAKAFEVLMHDMAEERDAAIARAEKAEARLLGAQAELDDLRKYLARDRTERDAALVRTERAEHERDMLALEVGRERSRAEKAEAEVTRLKKQLEYGDVTPPSAVAAEVAVLRENNEALGLKVNELEAEATAMRKALECIRNHHTYEDWRVAQEMADAALASDAGKAMLERLANAEVNAGLRECAADAATLRAEQARTQAFEEAAQVAHESLPCNCTATYCDRCRAVVRIRAKAKEGT